MHPCAVLLAVAPVLALAGETAHIDFAGQRWLYNPKHGQVSVGEHLGKQALRIGGRGCPVLLEGSSFRDGTIECDVATDNYNGFAFRAASTEKAEIVYFRPGARTAHEIQYVARGLGDWGSWAWLRTNHPGLYEGSYDLAKSKWFHVKAVVAGPRLSVHLDGATEPTFVVEQLKHPTAGGMVGFYGWSGWFANLVVTPAPAPAP